MGTKNRYTAVVTITKVRESTDEAQVNVRGGHIKTEPAAKETSEISRMVVRAKTLSKLAERVEKLSALIIEDEDE